MAYNGTSKEDTKILTRLDEMFSYALDHPVWVEARKKMIQCFDYREGYQWTSTELAVLAERGQPDTVNNQVSVTVAKLVGDLVDRKFRIGYRPRVGAMDEDVANILSDIFLYVRQTNDLEFEEREMAEDGFTGGMGVLDVSVTFDDMYQPEIKIRSEDCFTVFPDPDSRRYNWNEDADFIARARWFSGDEAQELYPKAKSSIESALTQPGQETDGAGQLSIIDKLTGKNYVDYKKQLIRIVDIEYKVRKREELVLLTPDETISPEVLAQFPTSFLKSAEGADVLFKQIQEFKIPHKIIDRVKPIIKRGIFAAGVLLEDVETDQKFFSLVPYFVYRRKNGAPYSLVTLALSMQDAINKRESKALHLLNTNQTVYERGAINDKEDARTEIHKPDGMVELTDGSLQAKRVEFRTNVELAQSQFTMHTRSQEDFYRITGVDPRIAQSTGDLRSNAALKSKFTEAGKPIAPIFDNLKRTRKILGQVILDRVQNYFTTEKVYLITDDQEKSTQINLNKPMIEKIKTAQYDAVVDEFVDTTTLQQEQFALLLQYLPQIIPSGPFWVQKLIQLSDIRDKRAILEELKTMSGPPPAEPRISVQANMDQLSPEERAFFYRRMGDEELAQQIMKDQPMTRDALKGSIELAKTKIQAESKERTESKKTDSKERTEIRKADKKDVKEAA